MFPELRRYETSRVLWLLCALLVGSIVGAQEVVNDYQQQDQNQTIEVGSRELNRRFSQFRELSQSDKEKYRTLYKSIQSHPDREQIKLRIDLFERLLKRLGPVARAELLRTDPGQRIARLRQLQSRPYEVNVETYRDFLLSCIGGRRDLDRLTKWLEDRYLSHFSSDIQHQYQNWSPSRRQRCLFQHLHRKRLLSEPESQVEEWSDQEIQGLIREMSNSTKDQLSQLPRVTQRNQLMWLGRLYTVGVCFEGEKYDELSSEELQHFLNVELISSPKVCQALMRLDPSMAKDVIHQLYYELHRSKQSEAKGIEE